MATSDPLEWRVEITLPGLGEPVPLTQAEAVSALSRGRRIHLEVAASDGSGWDVACLGTSGPPRRAYMELMPSGIVGDDLTRESVEAMREALALGWRLAEALHAEGG